MTISSFRALLQISHKQSEFSGKSEILGFFGEYAAYCDRERGTLYRAARLRGAPPDYAIAGIAKNQETEKWLDAGKWGFSSSAF
jgi:hypothetical protein